ncbi:MAG TPA: LLM class flavin-dependent oxidoreductase [Stellaceae bacterium]|jgi:5,10-methylenetetrahydromethanopterin reductase|nr:LLM class flavin-dependent oxidoreductase [Stellaceae bacterium]
MQVGFFFWPFTPELVRRMGETAERCGYDMIGVADTPGNAMDPWVAATLLAQCTSRPRIAQCVTNLASRHPAVSAAAAASLDLLAPGRVVLGIGTGHSGTRNLGLGIGSVGELEAGAMAIRALLSGRPAQWQGGEAHLPWIKRPCPVFLSTSGPKALAAAGRAADGAFVNFGIAGETIARSEAAVRAASTVAGRDPDAVEIWQIAALDCNRDGAASRQRIGAILAFMAAGYVLRGDLAARDVPQRLHGAIAELRRRYSTRPGEADAALVEELGLFDYLAGRFAVYGTPEECREQLLAARAAGLRRVMFTVSLAADPVQTVELFGAEVLPGLR